MEKEETLSTCREYFQYTNEYVKKYGEKTVVFMQVGAFYEIYGLKYPNQENITGSCIEEISEITGLAVASKKFMVDSATVYMAGFRDYSLDKYIPIVLKEGYIIVEIIQEPETETEKESKKSKKKTRILKDIHSIGTYVSYDIDQNTILSNNIVCIWLETNLKNKWMYGVAIINIYNGESIIMENEVETKINATTFDEIENIISVYKPSEVIFISGLETTGIGKIKKYLQISSKTTIHDYNFEDSTVKNVSKQKYLDYILNNTFGAETFQVCSEFGYYIYATQSFCFLIHFIQEHNQNVCKKIKMPVFKNATKKMILANHTLKQLNIISEPSVKQGHLSSVLSFLNKCNTAIGKRILQDQITNPVFCEKWLNIEYEMIAFFLQTDMIDFLRKQLNQIRDIEKISLQIVNRKIYPFTIHTLYKSLKATEQINVCIQEFPREVLSYLYSETIPEYETIISYLENTFIWDECQDNNNFQTDIFQKGVSRELDEYMYKHDLAIQSFESIRDYFITLFHKHNNKEDGIEYIKINETEKNGRSLQITKTRGDVLQTILKKEREKNPNVIISLEHIQFSLKDVVMKSINKSTNEIIIPVLDELCREIIHWKQIIQKKRNEVFSLILDEIERKYNITLEIIAKFIGKIDVVVCKAYLAKTYRYCCPEIIAKEKACVNAIELRHVLIEQLLQNEIYVPNDISLGIDIDGILLYGTNAVGKTSFIRSLGIAIIMAQSGMYVPCSKFQYKPYHAMYSRILGNDNLFKGLSTFAVEMSELRVILKQSNENSFILGDELCSGTETESALSIFMASLEHLHTIRSSFIFATHFHEIVDYDEIHSLSKIQLKHLAVWYDRETDSLVYDRKIKDGSGDRNYGLEVCKSLYLPEIFMKRAYELRRKYNVENDGSLTHKSSHYNTNKIKGFCEKCHIHIGEEIHHLQPQQMADIGGFIDGFFHKNHPGNLMTVCKKCHDEYHGTISPITMESSPIISKKIVRKKTTKGYIIT
jgi:DNA mismatch repair protein MutS